MFGWACNKESRREKYGMEFSVFHPLKGRELIGKKEIRTRVLDDDELRAVWRGAARSI
jgi:hypothetical protein